MNDSSAHTPELTTNHNQSQPTLLPPTININRIPLSQPLTNNIPTVLTNPVVPNSITAHKTTTDLILTSDINQHIPPKDNFQRLFHENDIYYVMDDYCQPVSESFNCKPDQCKFNRECLVSKQRVFTKGKLIKATSPTVFTSVPATSKKTSIVYMM